MANEKRIVLGFMADTHCNHRIGLMNPRTQLPTDQGPWNPNLTPGQKWLWDCFEQDVKELGKFVGRDDLVMFFDGDLTQGWKHKSDLVSLVPGHEILIALQALEPILTLPAIRKFYFAKGTDAHEGLAGSAPIIIQQGVKRGLIDVQAHYAVHIGELMIDIAHHGPAPGRRAWLRGNELRWYTRSLMMDNIMAGQQVPDILVRAHKHTYALAVTDMITKSLETYMTLAMLLPPYSLLTSFGRQVTQSPDQVKVGMVAVEVWPKSGRVNYRPIEFLHELDTRQHRKL